jgi:glycosyltransferase involved in cell wall biosynthesis
MTKPTFSVIIAIYKDLKNLELILLGLNNQSFKSFEAIIAEDNNAQETKDFVDDMRQQVFFPIKHVCQEDIGFRKTKALNSAVKVSDGEIIAFLDGDCVPHRHFLKAYNKNVTANNCCFGRRVFLNEKLTHQLYETKKVDGLGPLRTIFRTDGGWKYNFYLPFAFVNVKKKKGIYGCNWAIHKKNLIAVNGFDEDYAIAGFGEDADIEWRLRATGILPISTRNKSIVYHLYHKPNYTPHDIEANGIVWKQKMKDGIAFCKNGLVKIE